PRGVLRLRQGRADGWRPDGIDRRGEGAAGQTDRDRGARRLYRPEGDRGLQLRAQPASGGGGAPLPGGEGRAAVSCPRGGPGSDHRQGEPRREEAPGDRQDAGRPGLRPFLSPSPLRGEGRVRVVSTTKGEGLTSLPLVVSPA